MALDVAIDTGGTFTDCVYLRDGQLRVLKVFSTPADPGQAVLNVLEQLAEPGDLNVRHGTTVGTNAMLERKGARVAFVTTKGFEDTIAIGRQARPKLYDWFQPAPECLVQDGMRFGVAERTTAERVVLLAVQESDLAELLQLIEAAAPEAIAVSLLFSFANPENERQVATASGVSRVRTCFHSSCERLSCAKGGQLFNQAGRQDRRPVCGYRPSGNAVVRRHCLRTHRSQGTGAHHALGSGRRRHRRAETGVTDRL